MYTKDLSRSEALRFELSCEPTVQVAKQLSFSDEPITIFCDSIRPKAWVAMSLTYQNGLMKRVMFNQIVKGITLKIILPAGAHLDVLWVTNPEIVQHMRDEAKSWPMLGVR